MRPSDEVAVWHAREVSGPHDPTGEFWTPIPLGNSKMMIAPKLPCSCLFFSVLCYNVNRKEGDSNGGEEPEVLPFAQ